MLTLDKRIQRVHRPPLRAERVYAKQLSRLAAQVGHIIGAFEPGDMSRVPTLTDMLRKYAEALVPWATATASKMLDEVNTSDLKRWQQLSAEMSAGVKLEIRNAPTGEVMRRLLNEQVTLIKSIPLDAAQRVHELTIKAVEDGSRAKEIAAEIMRSGEVAKSRAMLIARTETSRAQSNFTQARAQHVGSEGYIWRTSQDGDVRPSHKAMNGKFVAWNDQPTLDGMTGHAGCLPNCRCWADVVLKD